MPLRVLEVACWLRTPSIAESRLRATDQGAAVLGASAVVRTLGCKLHHGYCDGLNCVPRNSCVEALTPSTSECDVEVGS